MIVVPTCLRCGSVRANALTRVSPCEYCGESPGKVIEQPIDDSWPGPKGLWREQIVNEKGKIHVRR